MSSMKAPDFQGFINIFLQFNFHSRFLFLFDSVPHRHIAPSATSLQ